MRIAVLGSVSLGLVAACSGDDPACIHARCAGNDAKAWLDASASCMRAPAADGP